MRNEHATNAQAAPLSDNERSILTFERITWRHASAKEAAIRDQFGVSSTRYYQVLNSLLDTRAALEYDPVLVKRLLRVRENRLASGVLRDPRSIDSTTRE